MIFIGTVDAEINQLRLCTDHNFTIELFYFGKYIRNWCQNLLQKLLSAK